MAGACSCKSCCLGGLRKGLERLDCRLPAFKRSKRFRRPPRQQLLQLYSYTCPCHLFFRGFKTAVCPPSNAPNASAGLQGNNSYSYIHALAICFSGGSRLPFARLQMLQTLPQASKATTLTAIQLYMPLPSVFQGVQDCRLPAFKCSKRFRRPARQQLLQVHAPAICFSGGSRLPFARLQTLQTLPQASKATTLTATCPCHLFFRGFKTAVCPPSNAPNASAGLQGNNSYSYTAIHALAICFSGGSRLPFARLQMLQSLPQASKATTLITATCPCHLFFRGFKTAVCPPSNAPNAPAGLLKTTVCPPRQQLLQLHAPAICFSGGSRLPFARLQTLQTLPQASKATTLTAIHALAICFSGGSRLPFARLQTLQTLPQASKATTLTATCPCHLFFRGFKTAVCPPSNTSNPPAGLQGNNSYSYTCPCHLFFRGFKTAVCPPSNAPNASAGLQGNNSYSYTCPCHLFFRGFKTAVCPPSNAPNASAGLQGNNSYSYIHALAICFSGGSRLPFARLQMLQTLPQASKATTLTAIQLYMPLPSVFQAVQGCRLPAFGCSKRFRRPARQQLLQVHAPAICFSGGSRLPFARLQTLQTLQTLPQASKATTLTATCPCHLFFRGFKTAVCPPSNAPNASAGLQGNNSYSYTAIHALAICFSGGSRLPFARLQMLQSLPQASKATTLITATCPCHLFFRGFKTAVCPPSNAPNAPAGLLKTTVCPPRQQLLQLHAPAICFSGGSRLPFARLQTLQTLPQASKATTLTAIHALAICFSGGSRLPFARLQTLQTLPQASKATTLTATCPCHLFFRGFKTAVCPPSNASNPPAGLRGNNSYSYTCPCHLFFRGFKTAACPPSNAPNASAGLQGNNSYSYTCPCHLFFRGFKTAVCPPSNAPNASAGLQGNNSYSYIHALAICFSGGSRLPFARLQMLQTLPQAFKATTLTAIQLYMPLPSVFQGVQDCRLPAFKCSKRFRRPPRQQLLQLHAPAICFSGGSRLRFARLQTLQTLPQASKATTLTATCPCHLSLRGFKTAVCPPSNAPNASAGLQGNNSYSYTAIHALAICFSGGSRLPFARLQMLQTLPQASQGNNSYSYMPLPSVFQGVQDCRLPAFKRSKRSRRPPQDCRLPLAATCPCHLFFRGFKTAVCPPSNAPNPSAGLQDNNSYSYMPLPSVFQGVHGQILRIPSSALKGGRRHQGVSPFIIF